LAGEILPIDPPLKVRCDFIDFVFVAIMLNKILKKKKSYSQIRCIGLDLCDINRLVRLVRIIARFQSTLRNNKKNVIIYNKPSK
jgi:hypothetical protein